MRRTKRRGTGVAWGAAVLGFTLALHASPAGAVDPINETWRGIAIHGYDAVAYFTEGKPVEGSRDFTVDWKDATWRFASAGNRDKFAHDPGRYAPQYGGYCAWAVSNGETADIDPEAWKIVDGKLYLNYNHEIQVKWEKDIPGNVTKANESWPRLLAD